MKTRIFAALLALAPAHAFASDADAADATLADLAFLEGRWTGAMEGLAFEETWSTADGGVMTAMARGVAEGKLAVLEYVVVAEESDGVVMRFKHFGADYSTWEGDGEPVTLTLTAAAGHDLTFSADPPSQTVKSVRYWMTDKKTLQVDVAIVEDSGARDFTLVFKRLR